MNRFQERERRRIAITSNCTKLLLEKRTEAEDRLGEADNAVSGFLLDWMTGARCGPSLQITMPMQWINEK